MCRCNIPSNLANDSFLTNDTGSSDLLPLGSSAVLSIAAVVAVADLCCETRLEAKAAIP
uniref:Expressed protein n=1 Tax=Schizophyllum commune (strain H4-8 / FGSC 9210) TaxID=578458 RepID=D8Q5S1_SCHCM